MLHCVFFLICSIVTLKNILRYTSFLASYLILYNEFLSSSVLVTCLLSQLSLFMHLTQSLIFFALSNKEIFELQMAFRGVIIYPKLCSCPA